MKSQKLHLEKEILLETVIFNLKKCYFLGGEHGTPCWYREENTTHNIQK